MTIEIDEVTAPPGARTPSGPRVTLWALRTTAGVVAIAVVAQPVLAGMYLGGEFDALGVHAANATALILLAMLQIAIAAGYFWPGGGRVWPLAFAVAAFMAVGIQTGMGYERALAIHIPLGVTIVFSQLVFTCWVFTRRAAAPRAWGRRR